MIARARAQAEYNRDMRIAWHVAALTRVEKLPALDKLMLTPPQTLAQQRQVLQGLSAQLGIPLRRVRLIRHEVA